VVHIGETLELAVEDHMYGDDPADLAGVSSLCEV
jgi:hypothetical protein